MIISCPSCSANYLVNIDDIGFGRQVKCTRCNFSWFYENKNYKKDSALLIKQTIDSSSERDNSKDKNLPVIYERGKIKVPFPFLILIFPVVFIILDALVQNSNINSVEFTKDANIFIERIVNLVLGFFYY